MTTNSRVFPVKLGWVLGNVDLTSITGYDEFDREESQ